MNDEAELLRCYADNGSEAAFTELVRRHVDLVYATALRRTGGDPHRAADVSQQVFTALARNARTLTRHPVLSAWLHTTSRNAAIDIMISEQRRKEREQVAISLAATNASDESCPQWDQVKLLLDDAVVELPEMDRAAVILRFLERKPYAEIGAALRVSEDAARVRTARALERLRALLARRGITSTESALAAMVTSQSGVAAPAGLAATLAKRAFVPAGAGSFVGVTSIMNIKVIIPVAVGAFILGGIGMHALTDDTSPPPLPSPASVGQVELIGSLRAENARLSDEIARISMTNEALTKERETLVATTPRKLVPVALTPAQQQERSMLNHLRQISAARDQFVLEYGRAPASVLELIGVDKYIREVNPVDGEDYSNLPMTGDRPLTLTTASGVTITYEPPPFQPPPPPTEEQRAAMDRTKAAMARVRELGAKLTPMLAPAIEAYRAANAGKSPPNNQALIPFFPTAQAGADFVEYIEAERETRRK